MCKRLKACTEAARNSRTAMSELSLSGWGQACICLLVLCSTLLVLFCWSGNIFLYLVFSLVSRIRQQASLSSMATTSGYSRMEMSKLANYSPWAQSWYVAIMTPKRAGTKAWSSSCWVFLLCFAQHGRPSTIHNCPQCLRNSRQGCVWKFGTPPTRSKKYHVKICQEENDEDPLEFRGFHAWQRLDRIVTWAASCGTLEGSRTMSWD